MRIIRGTAIFIFAYIIATFFTDVFVPLPFHVVVGQAYSGPPAEQLIHAETVRRWTSLGILFLVLILLKLLRHWAVVQRRSRIPATIKPDIAIDRSAS
jgi:hypothetical protein